MLSDHTESKDKFVMDSISFPPEAIVKILSYTDADDLTRLEEGASKQWTDLVKLAAREMAKREAKRWAKEGFYPTEEDVRVLKQLMKLGTITGMCNQIICLRELELHIPFLTAFILCKTFISLVVFSVKSAKIWQILFESARSKAQEFNISMVRNIKYGSSEWVNSEYTQILRTSAVAISTNFPHQFPIFKERLKEYLNRIQKIVQNLKN